MIIVLLFTVIVVLHLTYDFRCFLLLLNRTHGLKVTDRHIFWKLREQILVFDVLSEWSTEDHKLFPESFKAAVREILKGAFSKNNNKKDANLANLSADVLHKIFERAAFPVGAWQ